MPSFCHSAKNLCVGRQQPIIPQEVRFCIFHVVTLLASQLVIWSCLNGSTGHCVLLNLPNCNLMIAQCTVEAPFCVTMEAGPWPASQGIVMTDFHSLQRADNPVFLAHMSLTQCCANTKVALLVLSCPVFSWRFNQMHPHERWSSFFRSLLYLNVSFHRARVT